MEFPIRIPFVHALGFELLRFDGGEAELAFDPQPHHLNGWDVVHGGVSMTLLDVAMAHAARSPRGGQPEPRGVVTVEMKTSFLRPATGRLLGQGRVLQKTSTLAFCEGRIVDAGNGLVAHATGTFKYLRALPANGRQLKRLNASD